jgi:alkylated DNA repair dioxygenase AlkB
MNYSKIQIPQIQQINDLLKDTSDNIKDAMNQLKLKNIYFEPVAKVPGLYYCKNIIDIQTEHNLINKINNEQWLKDLSRRVQHYGYKYDYKKRKIDKNDYLGQLPIWTNNIQNSFFNLANKSGVQLSYDKFDQLIINEYQSKQGISAHIDCVPCFEDGIASLTLGCAGIMTFTNGKENHHILLERRSIVLMTNDARYKWTHSILPSKNRIFTNQNPRISLTFRKIAE